MKSLLVLTVSLLFGQLLFASQPPANYPIVNGIVRKIDLNANRISIKHEEIPNLDMPGMTMSFAVQTRDILLDLAVGDKIHFVADEVDGELMVLWLHKAPPATVQNSDIFCTGTANTTPKTKIELEIRRDKLSTIRYEFAEGSLKGTAYVNSIGRMRLGNRNGFFIARSGVGKLNSKLIFKVQSEQITHAFFTHYSANMKSAPVTCSFE